MTHTAGSSPGESREAAGRSAVLSVVPLIDSNFVFLYTKIHMNMPESLTPPGLMHKSLVQTIVESIERLILQGDLAPGERLKEQAMCDMLNVSRAPLREAFRVLENQGFLESKSRRGMFVSTLSRKEAINIYTIRANLESLAVFLAVKEAGPGLAAPLYEIHDKMKAAVVSGDVTSYAENNLLFHETLIAACGNQLLIDMLRRFNKQTARYRKKILSTAGKPAESIQRHEELLKSIENNDAEHAEELRKKSILRNIALVEKIFHETEDGPA